MPTTTKRASRRIQPGAVLALKGKHARVAGVSLLRKSPLVPLPQEPLPANYSRNPEFTQPETETGHSDARRGIIVFLMPGTKS